MPILKLKHAETTCLLKQAKFAEHSLVSLHGELAIGMYIALERCQEHREEHNEEDHENGSHGPSEHVHTVAPLINPPWYAARTGACCMFASITAVASAGDRKALDEATADKFDDALR